MRINAKQVDDRGFIKAAKTEIYQYRNFFGPVKKLELQIIQGNSDIVAAYVAPKIGFSADGTECIAEIHFYPEYDGEGNIISMIAPFDFK